MRYLTTQGVAYGSELGVFALALVLAVPVVPSNVAAKVVSAVLAYLLHGLWVFRRGEPLPAGSTLRYVLLVVVNIPLATALLLTLSRFLPVGAAKIMADVAMVGVNFVVVGRMVFRARLRDG